MITQLNIAAAAAPGVDEGSAMRELLIPEEIAAGMVTEERAFEDLGEEWNELVASSGATIYQTHEWQFLWWKHFGTKGRRRLAIVTVRNRGKLVAIAPLFEEHGRLGRIFKQRTLRLLGTGEAFGRSLGLFLDNGPSDYLDIMIRPGFEKSACRAIRECLEQEDAGDTLELLNAEQESHVLRDLLPLYEGANYRCTVKRADTCAKLTVPASLSRLLETLRPSVRRRLSQARKAESEGLFTIRDMTSAEELSRALFVMEDLHQKRWNRLGYPGLFSDGRFRRFMEDLMPALRSKGMIWCKAAESDGAIIAVRIVFVLDGCMYDYLSGFDDASPASRRRPGISILLKMVEESQGRGIKIIDFLRGDEQYKAELTQDSRSIWNVTISRRTSPVDVLAALARIASAAGLIWFLLARECRLIGVQIRQNGIVKTPFSYLKFRLPRMTDKMASLLGKPSNDGKEEH